MKKILLVTGGMDSTYIWLNCGKFDEYVYVKYGQSFATRELYAIDCLGIPMTHMLQTKSLEADDGLFWGRNLQILLRVREEFEGDLVVYFGNTADDTYPDNQSEFLQKCASIINDSYKDSFKVVSPLENMTKHEISKGTEYAKDNIYWCDKGNDTPCGECHSCLIMKKYGLM